MDFTTALYILGLDENFTEEELKKAYRKNAQKYHPDINPSKDAEEKMKEVNNAYDFLKQFKLGEAFRTSTYNNQTNEIELIKYKKEILEKMVQFWCDSISAPAYLVNKISRCYGIFYDAIMACESKISIDKQYELYLENIKLIYLKYEEDFYEEHYISKEDVKDNIRYECYVYEFYMQLLNIEKKYSRKIKFEKRVEEEIQQYKLYAGCTPNLWNLISVVCVHNCKFEASCIGYSNVDEAIKNMHNEIVGLFELNQFIGDLLSTLEIEMETIKNQELKDEYEQIKSDYRNGKSLLDVEKRLNNLGEKLKKEEERISQLEQNDPIVKDLHNRIVARCHNVITQISLDNIENEKATLNLLGQILERFAQYYSGEITLEQLLTLENVTFEDLTADKEIVDNLQSVGNMKPGNIYIRKTDEEYSWRDLIFNYVEETNDGRYIMYIGDETIGNFEVSKETLYDSYMTLDEALENAEFIGKRIKKYGEFKDILYKFCDGTSIRYIYIDRNKVKISSSDLEKFPAKEKVDLSCYRDPCYLLSLIKQQMVNQIKSKESSESQKRVRTNG